MTPKYTREDTECGAVSVPYILSQLVDIFTKIIRSPLTEAFVDLVLLWKGR